MKRPAKNEYNPYFENYVSLVPEGDFFTLFKENTNATVDFFSNLPKEKHEFSYAEGKWTPKQVLMHLIDTERVFAYRAFVASRLDNETELQSYDDVKYANNTDVSNRKMNHIVEEFQAVRRASETIFENLTDEQSQFINNVSGNPVSARAMAFIMIGHVKHHFNVVKERYL